jgi:hypothetical protein
MPGRVCVHLVALGGGEIGSRLEQSGTKGYCLFMCGSRVIDVKVEMHLLRRSMRPVGRNMVGCQLNADPPLSSTIDDAVPIVFFEDMAAKDTRPKCTFSMQVGRIKHDHLTHQIHGITFVHVIQPGRRCPAGSLITSRQDPPIAGSASRSRLTKQLRGPCGVVFAPVGSVESSGVAFVSPVRPPRHLNLFTP